ncbi:MULTISPECIES: hypothetical protein [Hyphomicrobiales]|uniref:hypothetical protein n=1 Tax=Hyphomicrobiales TaxID=356 RepID=UPI000F65F59C|nr:MULTISPECIES: hypothetical protein [Hyphomicrobiales]MCQ9147413.1 hypothetical protein [Ochrobactrum sp. BTU2]MDH1270269.1 hypothetical protein [Agrobacterium pusense]RSC21565.1 hypothetical protein EGT36_29430 [Agrobacterium sp. FDAARGOS_525]RSC24782.1 hypothetical protein EGT36_28570 [Agrobacterium sp. FDAARGOS_525]
MDDDKAELIGATFAGVVMVLYALLWHGYGPMGASVIGILTFTAGLVLFNNVARLGRWIGRQFD